MTDMMKKDNDISRVASGLMAVAVVALVIIGWIAAVVTSGEAGISKLEPWWRGLSAIFLIPLFYRVDRGRWLFCFKVPLLRSYKSDASTNVQTRSSLCTPTGF